MALAPQKSNPVPLIIFVVLFVFSTTGLVLVSMEMVKAHKQMNEGFNQNAPQNVRYDRMPRLKYALMRADERLREVEMQVDKFREVTGSVSPDKVREEMKPLLDELKELGESETAPSLMAYVEILRKRHALEISGLRNQISAANERVEQLNSLVESVKAQVAEKDTAIARRDAEIAQLRQQHLADIARKDQESARLRTDLAEARSAAQRRERELLETIKQREHEIITLRDRIQKEQEEKVTVATTADPKSETPDGKVLRVDAVSGVVLNIGRKEGVRPGMKFDVYTIRGDGTRIKRGAVEVKTVFPIISRAILVDGDSPVGVINEGDVILNPAFHPGRAKIFVADTVFDATKRAMLREALARYGGVLEDRVTIRTDYLITGAQRGDHYAEAEKLGIPVISENDLNAFLGR
jgi:NAD-dependent DNA ligase